MQLRLPVALWDPSRSPTALCTAPWTPAVPRPLPSAAGSRQCQQTLSLHSSQLWPEPGGVSLGHEDVNQLQRSRQAQRTAGSTERWAVTGWEAKWPQPERAQRATESRGRSLKRVGAAKQALPAREAGSRQSRAGRRPGGRSAPNQNSHPTKPARPPVAEMLPEPQAGGQATQHAQRAQQGAHAAPATAPPG